MKKVVVADKSIPATASMASDEPSQHRRRGRGVRRLLLAVAIFAVGAIAGALVFGGGGNVGSFRSAAGQDEYLAAYEAALAEGPTPSEEFEVTTDFGIVHVIGYATDEAADAAPLVLLPGTQSGAPMWAANVPSLAANRPVYVVDLLGQPGRSIPSRPIADHSDEARWLAQAIEQLPGAKPHVVGHSLGGWLAMNLAVHEPDAAASVIVLDPIMTFSDLSLESIVRSVPASVAWTPRAWRDSFASWTANDAPVDDEPTADMIEAGMQHYALGTPAPTRFTDEELATVGVPVLAILAGASRMHDAAAAAETAASTLTDATVDTYADASHAVTGEYPQRLARDIEAFLAAVARDNR